MVDSPDMVASAIRTAGTGSRLAGAKRRRYTGSGRTGRTDRQTGSDRTDRQTRGRTDKLGQDRQDSGMCYKQGSWHRHGRWPSNGRWPRHEQQDGVALRKEDGIDGIDRVDRVNRIDKIDSMDRIDRTDSGIA